MAALTAIQNFAVAGFPTLICISGVATAFTGTPFSVSGGTGASITSQACDSSYTARILLNPGSAAGTLTLTDSGSGATATINVRAALPTVGVTPLPAGAAVTFVDPVNGSDSTGARGARATPFLTVPAANTASQSGDTIQMLPGVETSSSTATLVTLKNGVNLRGSGIGISTINKTSTNSTTAPIIIPGAGSRITDISLVSSLAASSNGASIGNGAANTTGAVFERVTCFGYNDAVFYHPQTISGNDDVVWRFVDCQLTSFFDTWNYAINSDSTLSTLTTYVEFKHCSFTVLAERTATNHIARGISYGSADSGNFYVRLADCTFVVAGANTSASYGIYAPAAGAKTINFVADVSNTSITVSTIGSGTPYPVNVAGGTVNDLGGNTFSGGTNTATSPGVINTGFGGETTPASATVQANVPFTFQLDPLTGSGGSYTITVNSAANGPAIATVTMGATTASEAFSYTWTTVGTDILTFTNNGNLSNPPPMVVNVVPQSLAANQPVTTSGSLSAALAPVATVGAIMEQSNA